MTTKVKQGRCNFITYTFSTRAELNAIVAWKRTVLVRLCYKHVITNVCEKVKPSIGAALTTRLEGLFDEMTRVNPESDEEYLVFEGLVTRLVNLLPEPEGTLARDSRLQLTNILKSLRGVLIYCTYFLT